MIIGNSLLYGTVTGEDFTSRYRMFTSCKNIVVITGYCDSLLYGIVNREEPLQNVTKTLLLITGFTNISKLPQEVVNRKMFLFFEFKCVILLK